jgi:Glyoxalase-like domain
MAYNFQVAIDCADPHVLAGWWAEAIGWDVEPQDEAFIKRMIAEGHATDDDTRTYDGKLVWKTGAAIRHPDGGPRDRILFQSVPEPKTVKNRVHLDIRVGQENIDTERDRLTGIGATYVRDGHEGPHRWYVLLDPQGNELCIT